MALRLAPGHRLPRANSVAIGGGAVANRANSVAVGNRQIADVVAGTNDPDAVNIEAVEKCGQRLAAQAAVNVDGSITQPTYTVGGAADSTVGGAIDGARQGTRATPCCTMTEQERGQLKGASGTQIHNVAAGTADMDAVNLKQLKDAGLKTDPSGVATNAFVAYDDKTKKDSVTLEGAERHADSQRAMPARLIKDAVNLKQLKDAGLVDGPERA